ncbi:MAG: gliding motility-associated C-terminal domain-containing protein, partial [Cytophagales bacterium]
VNAGEDQIICADASSLKLSGSFTNTSNATWSAIPSGGTFSNTSMNPNFTPSNNDKVNGKVKIILSSANNSICPLINDTLDITITPIPSLDINPNTEICEDTNSIKLNGKVTIAQGGKWETNGSGSFSPSEFDLNAQYLLSENDRKLSSITTKLTTIGNGTCNAQSKSFETIINRSPQINAGGDIETCADIPTIALKATLSNATGLIWKTKEKGTFTPNNISATTNYQITSNDISSGIASFEIQTTGNGKCKPAFDFINVIINPTPSALVNAGFDQITCANKKAIDLNGSITGAQGGKWKTTGTGTFLPDTTNLNATYIPSAADTSSQAVSIILTTTGNGLCKPVTDTMKLTLVPLPLVKVNPPQTICADSSQVLLSGQIFNSKGGNWTSSGTGFFSPNTSQLSTKYIVATADVNTGKIGITLTTSDDELCPPLSASTIITITPKPTLKIPSDAEICSNIGSLNLNAEKTVARGIIWKTFGDGVFDPNAQGDFTNYIISNNDIQQGAVKISATTTVNGNCKPVTESLIIKFIESPIVNAGPDITICADTSKANLLGTVINTSSFIWKTLGSGIFSNANIQNPQYTPSEEDKTIGNVKLVLTTIGNTNCNSISDTMLVVLQKLPSITIQSTRICPDEKSAQLGVFFQNANTGFWSSEGTGTFSPNVFAFDAQYFPSSADIIAGKTKLSYTASSIGVCPNTTSFTDLITIPPPRADAGPDQVICKGSKTNLFAITRPNQTYQWQNIDGTLLGSAQSISVVVNNDTRFILTTSDISGCTSKDTMSVGTITPPLFNLAKQFCLTEDLLVNSNPTNVPPVNGLFQWARNNQNINDETKPIIFPRDAGKYKILYSFESCSAKDTTNITSPPSLISINKFGCMNDKVTLETSSLKDVTYSWSRNNVNLGNTNNLSVNTILDTNYYSVRVVDKNNCFTIDSVRIIGIPKPILSLINITACTNDNIVLRATPINFSSIEKYKTNYNWSKDNVLLSEKSDSLKINSAGTYIATTTVEVCSTIDTSVVKLNPIPLPIKNRSAEFCSESDKKVIIDANNGQPQIKYLWLISKNTTTKDTVDKEGYYLVSLSNQFNCKITDSIKVFDNCPPVIYVPNAFTPGSNNGDNGFKVFGRNFTNFQILVFSRWGEVIFKTNDRNEIWDGTYRGEPMPIGVYPYLINYEGDSEKYKGPYKTEGTITIVK